MLIPSCVPILVCVLSGLEIALAAYLPSKVAFHPSKREDEITAATATAQAERYLHNCKGKVELEKEAWDDANTLAKAALDWQPGKRWQPDADLYMGKDSSKSPWSNRITQNFKNAVLAHGRNWIWPDASIDVWCAEYGPDGLPPKPDEWKGPWRGDCTPNDFAYSYTRKHAYWFHQGYTIVFCPRFWGVSMGDHRPGKISLTDMKELVKEYPDFEEDPDILAMNRGETYLHELMHLEQLVSNPVTEDIIYQAAGCAKLANVYGPATKVPQKLPPSYNGEWGSTRNADSFALMANSIYFRELLKQQSPVEPPGWRDVPLKDISPPGATSDSGVHVNRGFDFANGAAIIKAMGPIDQLPGTAPVPVYEPPPAPPTCTAGFASADPVLFNNLAQVFCHMVIPGGIKMTLDQSKLSPPVPNAKIKVDFSFVQPHNATGCALSCIDTYTNLNHLCQYDSHIITGRSEVTMGCGTFGYQIQAAS